MKLRNRKTGEIIEFDAILPVKDVSGDSVAHLEYNSLTEFNEEWEDYEEPKEYWFISSSGKPHTFEGADDYFTPGRKEIGNYFLSREEAELALHKLKAWKRLKDKGFRFTLTPGVGSLDIEPGKFQIEINADMPAKWFCCDAVQEDLDDCFGGEE